MTIPNNKIESYRADGRCYIEFSFADDLAVLVPEIISTFAETTGITPEIRLSASTTLLIMAPLEDDDDA